MTTIKDDKVKAVKAKEDEEIYIESQNINNIRVFTEDGFFWVIGEHYGEEVVIKLSLKNLELIKKRDDGVFSEIGKNIKL
jgi:hypothetical protein